MDKVIRTGEHGRTCARPGCATVIADTASPKALFCSENCRKRAWAKQQTINARAARHNVRIAARIESENSNV